MKNVLGKLITLTDRLDGLGLKKHADVLDKIIARAAREEDFEDLTRLFDEPIELSIEDEEGPVSEPMFLGDQEFAGSEEDESPLAKEKGTNRLDQIKRRFEMLNRLRQEKAEDEALSAEETDSGDEVKLPVAMPEDLKAFEDEDDEDDIAANEADDGIIDKLKDVLKSAPELAKQLLTLVKDNPELLELLAL